MRTIVPVLVKADDQELPDTFAEGVMDNHDKNNDKSLVAGRQHHRLYTFGGRFWQVPEKFSFSKDANLLLGWILWLGVQAGCEYLNKAGTKQLAPV